MIVNASSNRSIRWSNGKPKARNSVSFQPAPRPSTNRPPLISSMVGGLLGEQRRVVEVRAGDERARARSASSTAAIAASTLQASHGPRGGRSSQR